MQSQLRFDLASPAFKANPFESIGRTWPTIRSTDLPVVAVAWSITRSASAA
jgi:hypothetical protein